MISVQKEQFLNAIKAVKSSVAKTPLQPILSTIHIKSENGGLTLTTTDLTTSSRAVCEANVSQPIEICINANSLENIISRLDNLITFELNNDGMVEIKSGKTLFKVIYIQATEFPEITFDLVGDKVTIEKDDFIKGVNQASISSATESQSILSGVCFSLNKNGYELAATDGNRLSQIKFDKSLNLEGRYNIPKKVLLDVVRSIDKEVNIYFKENNVLLHTGRYLFKQNLIDGTFPQYQNLIPTNQPHVAVIDRKALLSSLEKIGIMSDEKTNISVFTFKDNQLYLKTSSQEGHANDTIEISFDGELKIAFNYKFIIEGIKAMTSDVITFEMNTNISACVIKGDFIYLVMPINNRDEG